MGVVQGLLGSGGEVRSSPHCGPFLPLGLLHCGSFLPLGLPRLSTSIDFCNALGSDCVRTQYELKGVSSQGAGLLHSWDGVMRVELGRGEWVCTLVMEGRSENSDFTLTSLWAPAWKDGGEQEGSMSLICRPGAAVSSVSQFPKFPAKPCLAMGKWEHRGKLAKRGMSRGHISFVQNP